MINEKLHYPARHMDIAFTRLRTLGGQSGCRSLVRVVVNVSRSVCRPEPLSDRPCIPCTACRLFHFDDWKTFDDFGGQGQRCETNMTFFAIGYGQNETGPFHAFALMKARRFKMEKLDSIGTLHRVVRGHQGLYPALKSMKPLSNCLFLRTVSTITAHILVILLVRSRIFADAHVHV